MENLTMCFRYYSLYLARRNEKLRESLAFRVSLSLSFLYLSLFVVFIAVHVAFDVPYSSVAQTCLRGSAGLPLSAATRANIIIPVIVFTGVSLFFDALTANTLSQQQSEDGGVRRKKNYTIPLRATVFSALVVLPYVLIGFMLNLSEIPRPTGAKVTVFVALVMMAARCPLTSKLTFAAKQRLDEESRARRQEKERRHATAAKEQRMLEKKMRITETRV